MAQSLVVSALVECSMFNFNICAVSTRSGCTQVPPGLTKQSLSTSGEVIVVGDPVMTVSM